MNDQILLPIVAGFVGGLVAAAIPRVDLIPEEVGLGTTLAGAGATLGFLVDYRRGARDERWVRRGTLFGFIAGVVLLAGIAIVRVIVY